MEQPRPQEFDFHTHSERGLYPDSVAYSPDELVRWAAEIEGLDGIALTDHDSYRGLQNALTAAEEHGIILIPGVEITCGPSMRHPRFPHIVALLPQEEALKLRKHGERLPILGQPAHVLQWIQDHGGAAIAAHPRPQQAYHALSPKQIERFSSLLDGIETYNRFGQNKAAINMAQQFGLASIGSSDAHRLEEVGLVRTRIFRECHDELDVIAAIKAGQTQGFIAQEIPPELRRNRPFLGILKGWDDNQGVPPGA